MFSCRWCHDFIRRMTVIFFRSLKKLPQFCGEHDASYFQVCTMEIMVISKDRNNETVTPHILILVSNLNDYIKKKDWWYHSQLKKYKYKQKTQNKTEQKNKIHRLMCNELYCATKQKNTLFLISANFVMKLDSKQILTKVFLYFCEHINLYTLLGLLLNLWSI